MNVMYSLNRNIRKPPVVFWKQRFSNYQKALTQLQDAVNLSEQRELSNLEKQGLKNISLENTVDPSILGGFVLKFDDNQFDASIKNKLTRIKREFSKSL